MINDFDNIEDYCEALDKRKGYVYAIGHFGSGRDWAKDINRAFYIGKTLGSDIKHRVSSHEKREKGSESMYIEFHSHEEANYAEKVLISYLQPKKNKSIPIGYSNTEYSKILLGRFWSSAIAYKTDAPIKPLKYADLDDWDCELTEEMIEQVQEYLNDRVEIE